MGAPSPAASVPSAPFEFEHATRSDAIYRETFHRLLVAYKREDYQHIGDAATNEDTANAYNVTPCSED